MKAYFITGTDTNVGKTWVTLALMQHFKNQNLSVLGMKPVASGCEKINGEWQNSDALAIQKMGSQYVDYSVLNPYAYKLPISPHLAGKKNPVKLETIFAHFQMLQKLANVLIVEGAGGLYAPLNETDTIADLAKTLNAPIILVVAIRLGCINHALLTFEAIKHSNLKCAGWIAVCNDADFDCVDLTIESIKNRTEALLIGTIPYLEKSTEFNFENN